MRHWICALICTVLGATAASADVVGLTATNLVRIDPDDPTNVTVIGAHGLPANSQPFGVAYHRGVNKLYAINLISLGGVNWDQSLYSFDLTTGAATLVKDLGERSTVGIYEAFDYVDTLGEFVVAREPSGYIDSGYSYSLHEMDASGDTTTLLSPVLRDHDYGTWDFTRDIFYTSDPNGSGKLVEISLTSTAGTNIGSIPPLSGEMAYDPTYDAIFATGGPTSNGFYRFDNAAGGGTFTTTLLGQTPNHVYGIAYVDMSVVPLPTAALAGLGLLGALAAARRTRRRRTARHPETARVR